MHRRRKCHFMLNVAMPDTSYILPWVVVAVSYYSNIEELRPVTGYMIEDPCEIAVILTWISRA